MSGLYNSYFSQRIAVLDPFSFLSSCDLISFATLSLSSALPHAITTEGNQIHSCKEFFSQIHEQKVKKYVRVK